MDIGKRCNSGKRSVQLGWFTQEGGPTDSPSRLRSIKLSWKVLWLKLKREHKRIFEPGVYVEAPCYDEHTYLQNFDQGLAKNEPENLWRSFSVRYAKPSRKRSLV